MLSLAMLQEEHVARGPLSVEPGLMIWTVVVFVALLLLLRKYAWPAILGAVEARERALEEQLAEAERNRTEAARLLAEHQKLLAEGRTAAHGLLAEARAAAEKERALAMEKTRQEQEELLERARRDINYRAGAGGNGAPARSGGSLAGRGVEADR